MKIDSIYSKEFNGINNSANSGLEINSVYTNIITLNRKLAEVNRYLENDINIYSQWCVSDILTNKLSTFFMDDNSFFINEAVAIDEFINLSIEYFHLHELCSLDTTGVKSYNVRILSNFTESLKQTIFSLLYVQSNVTYNLY